MKRLIVKMKELDWWVKPDKETYYEIGKESPAGQDFFVGITFDGSPRDFVDQLYQTYEDFDVSYETYLWLDETGHGRRGAPWDMRDLYNDMEACEQNLAYLHDELELILESCIEDAEDEE